MRKTLEDVMDREGPDETEAAAPAPPPERPKPMPAAGADEPGTEQATPEEQAAYERTVLAGTELLYAEQTHDKIVAMLKRGADTPAETIARTAVMLLVQLDQQSKGTIPEVVIVRAAAEIAEQVAELANETGAFPVTAETLNEASEPLLMALAEQYDISNEELQEFMSRYPPEAQEAMRQERDQVANPAHRPLQRDGMGRPTGLVEGGMMAEESEELEEMEEDDDE